MQGHLALEFNQNPKGSMMTTQGGKRANAGRKPGSVSRRSRDAAESFLSKGKETPLEVLIAAMHEARDAGDTRAAAGYANMAAPYVHAKLASITSHNTHNGSLTVISEFPA